MKIGEKAKKKVPAMEAGTYPARCVGAIDLGEQYSEKFKNYSNRLLLIWEIPSETIDVDGEQKPRWMSKDYTISNSDKSNLKKTVEAWLGKTFTPDAFAEFDVFDLLGKECFISIANSENGEYANVASVMAMPKGMKVQASETPLMGFDMANWNNDVFDLLPEWIQEKIKKSTQYQKDHAPEDTISVDTATGEVVEDTQKTDAPKVEKKVECPI